MAKPPPKATQEKTMVDLAQYRSVWERVNALGGKSTTPEEAGYCRAIDDVLDILEDTGITDRACNAADEIERLQEIEAEFNAICSKS